jgi:TfoX/Sxy family transcriptional regulator of competence genes
MAYDEGLAQRVTELLEKKHGFNEKKMFGGVCYLLNGNMACGVLNEDLIVRIGPENYEDALKLPHTRKFDLTGKPMKGWVMVSHDGHESDEDLSEWVHRGANFALSLPPK